MPVCLMWFLIKNAFNSFYSGLLPMLVKHLLLDFSLVGFIGQVRCCDDLSKVRMKGRNSMAMRTSRVAYFH